MWMSCKSLRSYRNDNIQIIKILKTFFLGFSRDFLMVLADIWRYEYNNITYVTASSWFCYHNCNKNCILALLFVGIECDEYWGLSCWAWDFSIDSKCHDGIPPFSSNVLNLCHPCGDLLFSTNKDITMLSCRYEIYEDAV